MATVVIEPLKADVGPIDYCILTFLCLKHILLGVYGFWTQDPPGLKEISTFCNIKNFIDLKKKWKLGTELLSRQNSGFTHRHQSWFEMRC